MNLRKQLDIYNPNKHMQTPKETFRIGVAHMVTGFIAVITLGRYSSGLVANIIGDVMINCIHKRQTVREKIRGSYEK